jgi:Tfp pilus assembly protein PilF
MLMETGQPAKALGEYERSLKRDANRFWSVHGAARAAESAGNQVAARDYYARLQSLTAKHDTERPELTHASEFLAKQ